MDLHELTDRIEHVSQAYAARFGVTRDSNWQILLIARHHDIDVVDEIERKWLLRGDHPPLAGGSTAASG
jgi:hypothetical protein